MARIDYSNMIGKRFGNLLIIEKSSVDPKYGPLFLCQCDCGNTKIILGRSLVRGLTKSCGCMKGIVSHMDYNDIIGKRYGKLEVVSYEGLINTNNGVRISMYKCRCDCGNEVLIPREQLVVKNSKRKSCGRCYSISIEEENDYYRYKCANGKSFIFSKEDYDLVSQKRWTVDRNNYVVGKGDGKAIRLPKLLLNPAKGFFVDHINGNRLDNRRCNLRIASNADNNRNSRIQINNTTGYKGVRLHGGKYESTIYINSKGHYLGRYDTPEEAAQAYDEAARKYFGEFACVNFPKQGEQGCHRRTHIAPNVNSV